MGCGREGLYICKHCEIFLSETDNENFSVLSVWEHEGLAERLILKIKDGQHHIIEELVEKAFARIELSLPQSVVITYVPMFRKKQREQGFNPAELIARKLAGVFSPRKSIVCLLDKAKDNQSQSGLEKEASRENVRNVFKYCASFVPESVLLVDDFCATGSTIEECIRILKNKGVKNTWAFTLTKKTRLAKRGAQML